MLTGCSSKSAPKPSKSPQVTIDSPSVTQDFTPEAPDPTLDPSPSPTLKNPLKPAISEPKSPKNTPKPTTSPSPKAVQFDVALPWEDTPPSKLALPWTTIPPATTSTAIAIVQLDPNSILIAANRGLYRTASVMIGITSYRVERLIQNGDYVDRLFVSCPNGTEVWAGFFPGYKSWTTNEHPGTYTLRALGEPSEPCS